MLARTDENSLDNITLCQINNSIQEEH